MDRISNEELIKVNNFIESCNDMIDGKFILADVKIRKIISAIENCEPLYKFISNCLINFNFEKELQRAEVKNRFNGGVFICPEDMNSLVGLVFCLLVAFDTKKLDFYQFIKQNFETLAPNGEYANFSKTLLIPFRDCIGEYFGALKVEDEKALAEDDEYYEDDEEELEEQEESVFENIEKSINAIVDAVYTDRKIKEKQKQQFLYVLKSAKYALRYEDIKLISAFVTCFDSMAEKYRNIEFLLDELKTIIRSYYENNR